MQILDLKIPKYISSLLQVNKVPSNIKPIRGKGILETKNNFSFKEEIILTFNVNLENFKELVKAQARFQTMAILPVFDKGIHKKITEAYVEYKQEIDENLNINIHSKNTNNVHKHNINSESFRLKMKKLGYENIPNVNYGFFCFLENFSYKTIANSLEGFEVQMTLWICDDLTFLNDDVEDFMLKYYENFKTKTLAFEKVDKEITSTIDNNSMNIEISFTNLFNDRETYTEGKSTTQEAVPDKIIVPQKYITDLEVRSYNNLKRVPIQNKPRGFIQHLGKGEIAISVRLVFNEVNALNEEIINKFRSLTLMEQKHMISTDTNMALFKCLDIKEIDLINLSIAEPTDEVNATIVNLLFMAACTNREESDSDYLNPLGRGSTLIYLKGLENFLDKALQAPEAYRSLVIQSHDKNKLFETTSDVQDYNFQIIDLVRAYRNNKIGPFIKSDGNSSELKEEKIETDMFEGIFNDKVQEDIFGGRLVIFRFSQYAYHFLKNINTEGDNYIRKSIQSIDNTKKEFFDNVYKLFLSYQFNFKFDTGHIDLTMLNFMVGIELMNKMLIFIKDIIDLTKNKNSNLYGMFTGKALNNINILDKNGEFNKDIKNLIYQGVDVVFKRMRETITNENFRQKTLDFFLLNFYGGETSDRQIKILDKSITGARKKLLERFDKVYDIDTGKVDENYKRIIASIFKLDVLGYSYDPAPEKKTKFDIELQTSLIVYCMMSIFIPNLAFERADYGRILKESAYSLIGPMVITSESIQEAYSQELLQNERTDRETIEKIEKLKEMEKIIDVLFGKGYSSELSSLATAFKRVNRSNKDFQNYLNVPIYTNYERPLTFLKTIIENTNVSKNTMTALKDIIESANFNSKTKRSMAINELLSDDSFRKNLDGLTESQKDFFDEHVNTVSPYNTNPAYDTTMSLIGQIKYYKSLNDLTKLISSDYSQMMPDYEITIIDESKTQLPLGNAEYRNISDYFDIGNAYSINISKDDKTNIKSAIVKIANTRSHFIDANSYFKEIGFMNEEVGDTVLYSRKFVTERPELRTGMLINISLDQSSEYYDFTGKIDSIEIGSKEVVIKCTNFVGELMNSITDVNALYKDGITGVLSTSIFNVFKKNKSDAKNIANSKTFNDPNANLFTKKDFKCDLDKGYSYNVASADAVLFSAMADLYTNIPHLDKPYNDLIFNSTSLANTEYENKKDIITEIIKKPFGQIRNAITPHRIAQNINNVDRDLSFYGINIGKDLSDKRWSLGNASSFVFNDFNSSGGTNSGIFSDIYAFQVKNVSIYDILNLITLRSPGTFWEVYESGNYATLFLGRNNYQFKRKNKISKLTQEEINKIMDILLEKFTYSEKYTSEQLLDYYKLFKSVVKVYDPSIPADEKYSQLVEDFEYDNVTSDDENVVNRIYAVAGYNLASCNIQVNKNCPNVIEVEYDPTLSRKISNILSFEKSNKIRLKLFDAIPEAEERVKLIQEGEVPSIHTPEQAYEVAQSVMYSELRNYYSGKIVMLYTPDVRKNTEVVLMDGKNGIFGTVVVKDYEHIVDCEFGMITIITPGMKIGTTSVINDVYLHGLWNKIQFEMMKYDFVKNPRVAEKGAARITSTALRDNLLTSLKYTEDVPILLDGFAYNYSCNKDSEDKTIHKAKLKGVKAPLEQPFKIYPLIKKGTAIMPDSLFYGKHATTFYWITNLLLAIRYLSVDRILSAERREEMYVALKESMLDKFSINDTAEIRRISEIFSAFTSISFKDKILYEDYSELFMKNDGAQCVKIDEKMLKNINYGFMNCAKLDASQDERISKIAKIMFHFEIACFVEFNGKKIGSDYDYELDNFTVVQKMKEKLEEYSRLYNKQIKEWTIITADRLIDKPVKLEKELYDDIGAVIVNLPKHEADKYFEKMKPVQVKGSTVFQGVEHTKYRKVPHIKQYNVSKQEVTDIFVAHNYYGTDTWSVEIRKSMLDDLINKAFVNNSAILFGDFNLVLRSGINDYTPATIQNEYYNTTSVSPLIYKGYTTAGKKIYDNVLINESRNKGLASTFRYFNSDSMDYFDTHAKDFVSDHMPIFMMMKNKALLSTFEEAQKNARKNNN